MRNLISFLVLVFLTGCAHYPINPPLESVEKPEAYRFNTFAGSQGENLKGNFIILSLSGGGTRAAAFAYGVMERLDKDMLRPDVSVLDDVDVISTVSGGSFAGAYFTLYGKEKFLRDFRPEFLEKKVRSGLVNKGISPWMWPAFWSPHYGRSEMASGYYDKHFFKNKTFGDLPRTWPFLVINATDMSRASHFSFVQEDFDLLCSDLSEVKISRAAAASSAIPGALTPITLKNYPKSKCGYVRPEWVKNALAAGPDQDPTTYNRAFIWASYEDEKERPFVHLIDGSISDNLGIRSVAFALQTDSWQLLRVPDAVSKVDNIVLFLVNAEKTTYPNYDKSSKPPGFLKTLVTSGTNPG